MCGLVGEVGFHAADLGPAMDALAHRGPDSSGRWHGEASGRHVALGFRRLRIIDLSAAADQPMTNEDGTLRLVFNGELYNAPALRRSLVALGHAFRSRSDTECILHGYEQWGDEVTRHLRGMFAFALWDAKNERLLAARDRLGIKPFYWSFDGGRLTFGSELKALRTLGLSGDVDGAAIASYLRHLYVPAPATIFARARQLPAGHTLTLEKGGTPRIERYWEWPAPRPPAQGRRGLVADLRARLDDAVRVHLMSDVPLGAFLSGGVDSSVLVALAARASSRPLKTFTLTFDEQLFDERKYAQSVARMYGTEHTEIPISPNLVELLPAMVTGFDEPFGNPTALLVYALSRETRRHVTVALSGDGGDEMFLGYPRHRGLWLAELARLVPASIRGGLAGLAPTVLRDSTAGRHAFRRAREWLEGLGETPEQAYADWMRYNSADETLALLSPALAETLRRDPPSDFLADLFARAPGPRSIDKLTPVDAQSFLAHNVLAYSDRMSMAHGLEVRVPFCDHLLAEFAAGLPGEMRMPRGKLKWLFKEAVQDLLPPEVRDRRDKVGLNPPLPLWIDRELKTLVGELLEPDAVRRRGFVRPESVARLIDEHRSGKRDRSLQIWSLVVLEQWARQYLDVRSDAPAGCGVA